MVLILKRRVGEQNLQDDGSTSLVSDKLSISSVGILGGILLYSMLGEALIELSGFVYDSVDPLRHTELSVLLCSAYGY
jgi:hypothetical protein